MTLTMQVPEFETGQTRVFAVDLPPEEAEAWGTPGNVTAALGIADLPEGEWELFPAEDLAELGLSRYLVTGAGADPGPVRQDRARLDALRGHVLIVHSPAVRGQTLTPRAPLRWIGTYGQPVAVPPMEKLRSEAARGSGARAGNRPPPSDAAMSGRIASIALLVMFALVALVIWVAA